jgi:hypothetical protein
LDITLTPHFVLRQTFQKKPSVRGATRQCSELSRLTKFEIAVAPDLQLGRTLDDAVRRGIRPGRRLKGILPQLLPIIVIIGVEKTADS